jgi:hypothetical protein
MVGIVVKNKAARSQDSGDKKAAQAASLNLKHLMRGARNIETNSPPARIFPRVFVQ